MAMKIAMAVKLLLKLAVISQLFEAILTSNEKSRTKAKVVDGGRAGSTKPNMTNVECGAYEYIESTDMKNHLYQPYYVKLLRCQGADLTHAPSHRTCMPVESHKVYVKVLTLTEDENYYKTITLLNHTKCEYRCKNITCNKYQSWNNDTCSCDCNRSKKTMCKTPKNWVQGGTCCTCPGHKTLECQKDETLDQDTCKCRPKTQKSEVEREDNGLDMKSVLIIATLELILVVLMCSLIFYCCCHKHNKLSIISKIECNTQYKDMVLLREDTVDKV